MGQNIQRHSWVRYTPTRAFGWVEDLVLEGRVAILVLEGGALLAVEVSTLVELEDQKVFVPPAVRKFKEKGRRATVTDHWLLMALAQGRCIQCFQHSLNVTSPEDAKCRCCGAKYWVQFPTQVVATYKTMSAA